jgi:hypothetical protein
VVDAVPRTVAHDIYGGPGYHPPPDVDAVYFPIFEPQVVMTDADGDSWRAYMRRRRTSAFPLPNALKPINVDGNLAIGLFYRGTKVKIPVVRPRVIK